MNLNKIKQWVKNQVSQYELEEIARLVKKNDDLIIDLNNAKKRIKNRNYEIEELENRNEGRRIALIFITTFLILSLVCNALQFFNC